MGQQIGPGVVPELIAARVVEPAVVLDGQSERERSDPLHEHERTEDVHGADAQQRVA